MIRSIVRRLIHCREYETINDCLNRHIRNIKKVFLKKKYTVEDLKNDLKCLGIKKGDSLIIHSSWGEFYNFIGTPEDVINLLIEMVGNNGNIIMPCFGKDIENFNVRETKSAAGVLSEIFRTQFESMRSCSNHFSMSAMGPQASFLTKSHIKSINGFDELSPYARAGMLNDCKIIFLGLGKKPKKVSLIHVVEYERRNENQFCSQLFTKAYYPKIIYYQDGKEIEERHEMLFWEGKHRLNKKAIRKMFNDYTEYKHIKRSNLNIVSIDYLKSKKYISDKIEKGVRFTI